MSEWKNTLYYGDNLSILREYIANESVDFIYLDPPFNSNRNYNVLFKNEQGMDSQAQIVAFKDTWHWDMTAQATYEELVEIAPPHVVTMVSALKTMLGTNQVMAYLVMMTVRLLELHRVLKPTGSLYLHCDTTASHYLRIVLEAIFGADNFLNEIIWERFNFHADAKRWGRVHDVILFYAKRSSQLTYDIQRREYNEKYFRTHFKQDENGRYYQLDNATAKGQGPARMFFGKLLEPPKKTHWRWSQENIDRLIAEGRIVLTRAGRPRVKRYFDEMEGHPIGDVWTDIPEINSMAKERLGYPTQKPVALLERILNASTNEGDLVLDPFCGCGTTIHAAQKLKRRWIGIDITHLAIAFQKYRLKDAFNLAEKEEYLVIGEPKDVDAARHLAQADRYQFQWWALSLIQAQPVGGDMGKKEGKKGKDRGIDGLIMFLDDPKKPVKKLIVQVKSGKVSSGDIRDLAGTIEREQAAIGVFITLEPPSQEMQTEAASAGSYSSEWAIGGDAKRKYPKIQVLTIAELLAGASVQMPPTARTYKKSQKETVQDGVQEHIVLQENTSEWTPSF